MPLIERTESKFFIFLVGFAAVSVAIWAAIFSVTGLSMLYSGSMLYIAIAMGVLEFSKLILASLLYRDWNLIPKWLRPYLLVAMIVLMLVTSGGIYGYLTNSYQGATVGLDKINSQTQVLEQRKQNYTDERERIKGDLESLRAERRSIIDSRNNEIRVNDESTDSLTMKYRSYRNRKIREQYKPELDNIDTQIAKYMVDLDSTNVRLSRANNDIANQKLEIIDTGVEIGPLMYMARIFNTTMDEVMKWFTLVIVFVFDPLAIALVLALNIIIVKKQELQGTSSGLAITVDRVEPEDMVTVEAIEAKPVEKAFDDIQEKIDKFKDEQEDLDDDFSEALDEVTKRVGKDKPSRPRFSKPNPKKDIIEPLEKLVDEIKEKPTKDIVVPLEDESEEKPDETIEPPKFDLVHEAYMTKKDEQEFVDKPDVNIMDEPLDEAVELINNFMDRGLGDGIIDEIHIVDHDEPVPEPSVIEEENNIPEPAVESDDEIPEPDGGGDVDDDEVPEPGEIKEVEFDTPIPDKPDPKPKVEKELVSARVEKDGGIHYLYGEKRQDVKQEDIIDQKKPKIILSGDEIKQFFEDEYNKIRQQHDGEIEIVPFNE